MLNALQGMEAQSALADTNINFINFEIAPFFEL